MATGVSVSACRRKDLHMKPRITLITIGVDDLERSLRFYRDGLGLETEGIVGTQFEHGAVVFFELQAGLRLALWPRTSIAHDSGLPVGRPSHTEFTIAHNVASKAEVDAVMEQARRAGAVIVKPAHDAFWGRVHRIFPRPRPAFVGSCMESGMGGTRVRSNDLMPVTRVLVQYAPK